MTFEEVNSWYDFETSLHPLGKKAKGDAFEQLTYWFFRLNEVHASQYEKVWLWQDVPERIMSSLNLPNQDLGIDLLLQKGDEYHAVQCKYHSNRHASVTFREVATFLSVLESNDRITLGYVCSSANGFSANLRKVSQNTKQVQRVLSDTWSRLDQSFFDAIRLKEQGQTRRLEPFQPRAHQRQAIENAVKHFEADEHRRGKLIFPCGSGKSLTGYWIAQALNSKKTLVAVPSLSLVKQTIEVYLRESVANKRHVKWICICSDDGIGRGDDVVMYHNDLGIPCETDHDQITKWLKTNANEDLIVFTTYQSGRVIAEAAQHCAVEFELGIFDEAHKTVGSKEKLFSHLLFDENIAIARRVFMTATERFYRGLKDTIISMDDEQVYGDTFAQMTFKEAIEQQLLTDYKVITIEVQEAEVADFIRQNNLIELDSRWGKEAEARSLASMLALRKAMKRFPIRHAVSFHGSIDKAKRCKELQTYITDSYGYAQIDSYTVSGKIPTAKRNDIVQEFAGSERGLITNARCLTEGVDVPNIDCIVFADPKRSKVDIVQALGRALRKKEEKEWGYVVLPVIYNAATGLIDNENFSEILSVVRGLASNDDRIVEYLRDKNENGHVRSGEHNQFNLQVISEFMDAQELSEQLEIRLWEKLAHFSWLPFLDARSYVRGLNLGKKADYVKYVRGDQRRLDLPTKPHIVYQNDGWMSYGDFLGYSIGWDGNYRSFEDARAFVRTLGLKSISEWNAYCDSGKKPNDIPYSGYITYKGKGWISTADYLGHLRDIPQQKVYREFGRARSFVRNLKLQTQKEWNDFCANGNKPDDIPSNPRNTYEDKGWQGFDDWIGTGRVSNKWKKQNRWDFNRAREYVRTLGLKKSKEWGDYCASGDKPKEIPRFPARAYKDEGWIGMPDWLGTHEGWDGKPKSFEEMREFARSLKIKTRQEWVDFCSSDKSPPDVVSSVQRKYEDKWKGWSDFLGSED